MNKKLPLPKKLEDLPTFHGEEINESVHEEQIKNLEATVEAFFVKKEELETEIKKINTELTTSYANFLDANKIINKQNEEIEQLKLDNEKLINTMNNYDLTLGKQTSPPLHLMERIAVQSPFVVNRFRVATGWIYTFQTPTGLTSVLETDSK